MPEKVLAFGDCRPGQSRQVVTGHRLRMTGAATRGGCVVQLKTPTKRNRRLPLPGGGNPTRPNRKAGDIAGDQPEKHRHSPAEIGLMASPDARSKHPPAGCAVLPPAMSCGAGQPSEGKIYDSNLYSIASLVKRYGCVPKILGIARDEEKSLVGKLKQAQDADMLLTTGGVSMGDYDMVKDILARDGRMVFWQVKVKPGKPLAFGKIKGKTKDIPHLGLPGNAVSCMVSFELFVRPALLKMMGKKNIAKPGVEAILEDTVKNDAGRRIYDRAIVVRRDGHYYARLTGPQGSGILKSMSLANGLVLIPEEKAAVKKGETVQALMLDWNEEVNL
jgi:molybdenum cofactor synthesis domain-containing protein